MIVLSLFLLAALHPSLTIRPASAFLGPISTAAPNLAGGKVANTAPPNTFFQGFQPPFPTTGDWWVGFAAGNGDA
jgi:endo-1,3(4)-beta-glucanase